MSVGELMNIYRDGELIVSPEFQRLFRWNIFQKSHLIESLLIGVPIPSIFVFETEDGKWELIDGLQRVSTILEFTGLLKDADSKPVPPSILSDTRYLPSLDDVSWDGTPPDSKPIGTAQQISIKRARLAIQILKKTSDEKAKYDLFQRLNSHGSTATPQELRNCVLYMINKTFFRELRSLADDSDFSRLMHQSDIAQENQSLMDFITRFFVFIHIEYDKSWDIEEYLDNGMIEIATSDANSFKRMTVRFKATLDLFVKTGEFDILKRFKDNRFQGRVGQAAFETIFLGVAQNLAFIKKQRNSSAFILKKAKAIWARADVQSFTKAGQRGTDRIQKSVEFGRVWFSK